MQQQLCTTTAQCKLNAIRLFSITVDAKLSPRVHIHFKHTFTAAATIHLTVTAHRSHAADTTLYTFTVENQTSFQSHIFQV